MRVLVTRRLPDGGLEPLAGHELVGPKPDDTPFSPDELRAHAAEVDAIVSLLTDRIDADVLAAGAGRLRVVGNVAVGYDNVDIAAAAAARRRRVQHAGRARRDDGRHRVPADARRGPPRVRGRTRPAFRSRGRRWGINEYLGQDVHDAVLGVVGFGRIGRAVAERGAGLRHAGDPPLRATRPTSRATSPISTRCSRTRTS